MLPGGQVGEGGDPLHGRGEVEQHALAVGLSADPVELGAEGGGDDLAERRARGILGDLQLRDDRLDLLPEQRAEQLLPHAEAVVEGAVREPGLRGDGPRARPGDARDGHHAHRGVEELGPPGGP
ncbi:hypothetical protein CMsap09_14825 [Clavibacter michiganensis]|uniref:Uncharacterized protein n=1 Tax=Clavibacter michiganensis TaxID=28447 RepID=A0A251XY61_9MICO|nr:hypothetical protein CMsap09_14825 [Clavibacter michiganensis]